MKGSDLSRQEAAAVRLRILFLYLHTCRADRRRRGRKVTLVTDVRVEEEDPTQLELLKSNATPGFMSAGGLQSATEIKPEGLK